MNGYYMVRRRRGGVEAVMRVGTEHGDALTVYGSREAAERGRAAHGNRFDSFAVVDVDYAGVLEACEAHGLNLFVYSEDGMTGGDLYELEN